MSRQEFYRAAIEDITTEELAKIADRFRRQGKPIPSGLLEELITRKDYQLAKA
jgi:hypothetical protein